MEDEEERRGGWAGWGGGKLPWIPGGSYGVV